MPGEKWIALKKKELSERISKLALKIVLVTADIKKFGPKRYRKGLKIIGMPRSGMFKHWEKMAKQSLMSTRKKIYRLEEELKSL